ncbi:hypothetical protein MWU59_09365 [Flavobacteriaceae bacterium F08102]|nr:hypothetical protein [Flavobacteriaceae bacterium F08102]
MKPYFTLATLLIVTFSYGQFEYDASTEFPYGRANPNAPQQIKDYAALIGKCTCTSTSRNADGSWADPVKMTWTFRYIMNGMAVQDETLKTDGKHSGSIRQYSQDSARWYVHYYTSAVPVATLPHWEGNTIDGIIRLYKPQKSPNGMDGSFRLSFYDITKNGYKWIGEWVDPEEKIVYPTWKIDCIKEE